MSDAAPLSLPPVELSENIIHDQDVLRVVNELWASGAEAISINNIRLGPNSSVRCVGPVVNVNGAKVASPIKIRAIGDQDTLLPDAAGLLEATHVLAA